MGLLDFQSTYKHIICSSLKHSSMWTSAYIKPMSKDLVIQITVYMQRQQHGLTGPSMHQIILHLLNTSQRPKARVFSMDGNYYFHKSFENLRNTLCIKVMLTVYLTQVYTLCAYHRYQKTKIDCFRFVMCPLLALVFQGRLLLFFMRPLTVLMRQTRPAVRGIHQSILLRCLWCILYTMTSMIILQLPQF